MSANPLTTMSAADAKGVNEFVFPEKSADKKLLEYWSVNGHLFSTRYVTRKKQAGTRRHCHGH